MGGSTTERLPLASCLCLLWDVAPALNLPVVEVLIWCGDFVWDSPIVGIVAVARRFVDVKHTAGAVEVELEIVEIVEEIAGES